MVAQPNPSVPLLALRRAAKSFGADTRGLILRIVVVVFLAVLFWQAVIAAGRP